MLKAIKLILIISVISLMLSACGSNSQNEKNETSQGSAEITTKADTGSNSESTINNEKTQPDKVQALSDSDLVKYKVNESGKIMVFMFHNFIESYNPDKDKLSTDAKRYTNTFEAFRELLNNLYDKGYRLINVNDYIDDNIKVAAGFKPVMFTFDDGTAGQFNLVKENGVLVVNKNSAVGIMEEFNKLHPDFGLKGTFYVNLGGSTFSGEGTLAERLKYLVDKGFEIGNHTLNHINLKTEAKTREKVEEEIGGNQKKLEELLPGYKIRSLALPLGNTTKDEALRQYVVKGEYQGTSYENQAIMLVGSNPAPSINNPKVDPYKTPRVRASGILEEDMDSNWWLKSLKEDTQYISDGDPDTVTVPKDKEALIDKARLKKKLREY